MSHKTLLHHQQISMQNGSKTTGESGKLVAFGGRQLAGGRTRLRVNPYPPIIKVGLRCDFYAWLYAVAPKISHYQIIKK